MRSRLSPPSDPLKPRPSSAIIFAGNAVVFLVLSLLTQRMIYSFLFCSCMKSWRCGSRKGRNAVCIAGTIPMQSIDRWA